jgi:hypothetical protein
VLDDIVQRFLDGSVNGYLNSLVDDIREIGFGIQAYRHAWEAIGPLRNQDVQRVGEAEVRQDRRPKFQTYVTQFPIHFAQVVPQRG